MNESINLLEILKDAPRGTILWSSICGVCILDRVIQKVMSILFVV